MNQKKRYEAPRLRKVGAMTELTKEYGWGFAELFASIISGGPISIGRCEGNCFS